MLRTLIRELRKAKVIMKLFVEYGRYKANDIHTEDLLFRDRARCCGL